MAMIHVGKLAQTARQRLVMDLVVVTKPANTIQVQSGIMLARANIPAKTMKVPSIVDVIITVTPAIIINGILK